MTTKYLITQELATPVGIIAVSGIATAVGACLLANKKHAESLEAIDEVRKDLKDLQEYVKDVNPKKILKAEVEIETLKSQNLTLSRQVVKLNECYHQIVQQFDSLKKQLTIISQSQRRLQRDERITPSLSVPYNIPIPIEGNKMYTDNKAVSFPSPSFSQNVEYEESFDLSHTHRENVTIIEEILPLPVSEETEEEEFTIEDIARMAST
jgi:hypothetical protein